MGCVGWLDICLRHWVEPNGGLLQSSGGVRGAIAKHADQHRNAYSNSNAVVPGRSVWHHHSIAFGGPHANPHGFLSQPHRSCILDFVERLVGLDWNVCVGDDEQHVCGYLHRASDYGRSHHARRPAGNPERRLPCSANGRTLAAAHASGERHAHHLLDVPGTYGLAHQQHGGDVERHLHGHQWVDHHVE